MPTSQRKRKAEEQERKKAATKCRKISELWETRQTPVAAAENSPVTSCTSLPPPNVITDNLPDLDDLDESVSYDTIGITDDNSRPVIADCTDNLEVSPPVASDNGETLSNLDPLSSQLSSNTIPVTPCPLLNLTVNNPTDPGRFIGISFSDELKQAIIEFGPCQPSDGLFATNRQGRHFQLSWYSRQLPSKQKVQRDWLVYSHITEKMYCFCCWLFSKCTDPLYEGNWAEPAKGVQDFKKGIEKIRCHESSAIHLASYTRWKCFQSRSLRIDQQLMQLRDKEIECNRKVLERLLDIVLYLAKQNLPLRGHDESADSKNKGNFLELVKLLAKYDVGLATHLSSGKRNQLYLSSNIQNDFIQSIGDCILKEIVSQVKMAKYYSIMADTTTDVSHEDQFSLCLRYVDQNGSVQERFTSFHTIPSGSATAMSMESIILDFFDKTGLDIADLRGQSYDGASNMSGKYNGLQARLKQLNGTAFYFWCANHRLNLVLADAAHVIVEAKSFFGLIERLYTLFTASHKRFAILEDCFAQHNVKTTIKRLIETRWSARHDAIKTVRHGLLAIIDALEEVSSDNSAESVIVSEVDSILSSLQSFKFLLQMCIWDAILSTIKSLSDFLQNPHINLLSASDLIKATEVALTEMRSNFNVFYDDACTWADELGITASFPQHRSRRRKHLPGEVTRDEPITDPLQKFKVEFFNVIVDTCVTQINTRFADFHEYASKFALLSPKVFMALTNQQRRSQLGVLAKIYNMDIDEHDIQAEFQVMVEHCQTLVDDIKTATPHQLFVKLVNTGLQDAYPNICTLYRIFLTLPVTSTTVERSMSKLKLIKSYLRSTMGENRLSMLALISIEKDLTDSMNFNDVINTFARMKNRRMTL